MKKFKAISKDFELFFTPSSAMMKKILQNIGELWNKGKIISNQKVITFLFFLLLSSLFWLLNALNEKYNATVTYPVHYTSLPKKKVLIADLPGRLSLNVNAHGYTLLKYKLTAHQDPIIFNVNAFDLKRFSGENNTTYYILTRSAVDRIGKQLSAEIKINDIMPDTLFFKFADRIVKKVPVKADLNIELQKQYMIKGNIYTNPDSITVTGPHVILDTLSQVKTKPLVITNVAFDTQRNLPLKNIDKVTFSKKRVTVNIPVEKFTEESMMVPVQKLNVPEGLDLKVFPSAVKVSFNVGLSDYALVNPDLFTPIVDYNDIEKNLDDKLRIQLKKQPSFVNAVKYHPKFVDYLIEK